MIFLQKGRAIPQILVLTQVIFSALPGIVFWSAVPLMLSSGGLDIYSVGMFFFVQRLIGLFSPFLVRPIMKKCDKLMLAVLSELLIAAFMFLAYLFSKTGSITLGFMLPALASVAIGGILVNSRVTWLKEIENINRNSQNTVRLIAALIQIGYGLGGLVLLLTGTSLHIFQILILVNGFSSIIGAMLLAGSGYFSNRGGRTSINYADAEQMKAKNLRHVFNDERFTYLYLSAFFLYGAFGGANVMVLKAGQRMFLHSGGYPFSLAVYGCAFVVGSFLAKYQTKIKIKASSFFDNINYLVLSICLLLNSIFFLQGTFFGGAITFAGSFIFYAMFLIKYEGLFFEIANQSNISTVFAFVGLTSGTVWAFGEIFYSLCSVPIEYLIRAVFVTGSYIYWRKFNMVYNLNNDGLESLKNLILPNRIKSGL